MWVRRAARVEPNAPTRCNRNGCSVWGLCHLGSVSLRKAVAFEDVDHLPDGGDLFGGSGLEPTNTEGKFVTSEESWRFQISLNHAFNAFSSWASEPVMIRPSSARRFSGTPRSFMRCERWRPGVFAKRRAWNARNEINQIA